MFEVTIFPNLYRTSHMRWSTEPHLWCRGSVLTLMDRMKNSGHLKEVRRGATVPLCWMDPVKLVWAFDREASLWRYTRLTQLGGDPRVNPERTRGILYPIWSGGTRGCSKMSLRSRLWRMMSGQLSFLPAATTIRISGRNLKFKCADVHYL